MTEVPQPPAHIEPYVRVLGPDLAIDFLLAFGGAELFLPRSPRAGSRIVEVVGADLALALAETDHLPKRVPTGKVWIAQVLITRGLSVAEIARRLHTSDVTVRKYLARGQDDRDERQPRFL